MTTTAQPPQRGLRLDLALASPNALVLNSRRSAQEPNSGLLRRAKHAILVALLERAAAPPAWHSALLKLHDRGREASEPGSDRRKATTSSDGTHPAGRHVASDPSTDPNREIIA